VTARLLSVAAERLQRTPVRLATPKRLRLYPLATLVGTWAVLLAHVVLRTGWMGALGQRIAPDFVTLYAAGLAFGVPGADLYDLDLQRRLQELLIQPTPLGGVSSCA
jgi:hypothetical protein